MKAFRKCSCGHLNNLLTIKNPKVWVESDLTQFDCEMCSSTITAETGFIKDFVLNNAWASKGYRLNNIVILNEF